MRSKFGLVCALGILACILLIGAFPWFQEGCRRRRDARDTSRCANAFGQIESFLDIESEMQLPSTDDTRKALAEVSEESFVVGYDGKDEGRKEMWDFLSNRWSACPESYRRDSSIGYVYVGDGLVLSNVWQQKILILFCPAENHRGYSEHCHAWADPVGSCVRDNAQMIKILRRAIARGESGEVRYSERAMKVLREQLAKRL